MNAPSADPLPVTNHVFVDFENVQQVDFSLIGQKTVSFTLLVGARQKVQADLVEILMQNASSVHFVRLTTSGRNALDFALAYYIGRSAVTDPTGHFHIISKDTGFDPLVEHLRSRHIHAHRHDDFSKLTFGSPGKSKPTAPKESETRAKKTKTLNPPAKASPKKPAPSPHPLQDRAIAHLRKQGAKKPKKKKTLVSDLMSFLKPAPEADVLKLVESLQDAGNLAFDDKGIVSYPANL
jgi:hypothetical protein